MPAERPPVERGGEYATEPGRRLAERHFVHVTRMAKDNAWADIRVSTWAVSWSKRQPLVDGRFAFEYERHTLTSDDLFDQQADHMAKLGGGGGVRVGEDLGYGGDPCGDES